MVEPAQAPPARPLARTFAAFAAGLLPDAVPERVRAIARLQMLDAIGVACAAASFDFARHTADAMRTFGGGDADVIGMPIRLALRDAVLVNGVLVHGLDFDDTSIEGRVHPSSSSLPAALALAADLGATGRDLLTAYALAMEITIRIGRVAKGGFQAAGWHPTGVAGVFGAALACGHLLGLTAAQLTMAQGIACSMAAGTREFVPEAAWTKRLHAGWAGVGGLTAAVLARGGFTGPSTAYDGASGLYRAYLGPRFDPADLALATEGLGEHWTLERVSPKPLPSCHFNHPFIDAAIALAREHRFAPEDVEAVEALVPQAAIAIVCEPRAPKLAPADTYAALFSVYYAIGCALVRGSATLADHEPPVLAEPAILALAAKVRYAVDPRSSFPRHYGGALVIHLRDGRTLERREDVNRGAPERPLASDEITAKFHDNAARVMTRERAQRVEQLVARIDQGVAARTLARAVSLADP